jgi:hypothetical protein
MVHTMFFLGSQAHLDPTQVMLWIKLLLHTGLLQLFAL